ncbi:MAG: aminoacetone oxidase family FAD-binding enzyme [Verrucomicrobiota bacterium]|nr:aminoacetone oxidase family FAD-binding enzyme [Verrucomicrobiota bacterium]
MRRIAIIGGGAAGFFAALAAAKNNPSAQVDLYERGTRFLTKVKISGGGRCNVTHKCFDPDSLSNHYPRGARELKAAFYRWQPQDTLDWFTERGVTIKAEADGRMFPTSDDSQTIIDCFLNEAHKYKIGLHKQTGLQSLAVEKDQTFQLKLSDSSVVSVDSLCLACGSLKANPLLQALKVLGHDIKPLAASLFSFNVSDKRLSGLAGLAVKNVQVQVLPNSNVYSGPLLITHRGLSGPSILRCSAWEALTLKEKKYHFDIRINWLGDLQESQLREQFNIFRENSPKKSVKNTTLKALPKRLWKRLVQSAHIEESITWAQLPKKLENSLIIACLSGKYSVQGKTTNKEEFVTCGGVDLKQVDFRRMESKIIANLHFAGECMNLDGITGGFNFQAAWTTGYIAGESMAKQNN